jgi:outer membrane protein TolC
MIGLSLRLNLFNGLADRGRLQQAQAGLVRAQARRDEVENRLRLELRRALVERVAANKKLSVAEGAVDQARESHRITQARFEGGLTSVTDLLRSETALLSAEARHLGALYETKLTEVGLELAMGTLDQSSEAFQR